MTDAPEWTPERSITPELAAAVIADQFPDLAGLPVRRFDAGWDNAVLTVGDEWLFRFIHRSVALDGARRELAVLTRLANRFATAVPLPERVGRPTDDVPWPFWGTRMLPGRELAVAGLDDEDRVPVAEAVGGFLRALHAPDVAVEVTSAVRDAGMELPVDPMRRGEPAVLAGRVRPRLDRLVAAGAWQPDQRVDDLLRTAAALGPPTGRPVLVHGDLHVRHVLVADGRATGVIDWGDTALADPAVDLMIGFGAFVGPAREGLLAAYGAVPAERVLRARALAVHVHAAVLEQATTEGMAALAREAAAAIGRAVTC